MSCPPQIYKDNDSDGLGILDRFGCWLQTEFEYSLFSEGKGSGEGGIAENLDERRALKTTQVPLLLLTFLNCMQKLGYHMHSEPFFMQSVFAFWDTFLLVFLYNFLCFGPDLVAPKWPRGTLHAAAWTCYTLLLLNWELMQVSVTFTRTGFLFVSTEVMVSWEICKIIIFWW